MTPPEMERVIQQLCDTTRRRRTPRYLLDEPGERMTYLMGIDGGGSTIRVVVVAPDMARRAQTRGPRVNPYVIGREKSAAIIQAHMRDALAQAAISPDQITGVGVGIAGAAATQWQAWLRDVVGAVVPRAQIVTSSDVEIALVGAHGSRRGVLILAGTGSSAYAINDAGESRRVGGWGYLLGDEGSGFWLGIQALRAITRAFDDREMATILTSRILTHLGLQTERDLLLWLHGNETLPTNDVARLAPLVIEAAAEGDVVAQRIVEGAAQELALLGKSVIRWLATETPPIAFAGSLLENANVLSLRLCDLLGLPEIPVPQYPPVIGAALLAKLTIERGG